RYSLSMRTHGSSCRRRASSSLPRVSSFSASSSFTRSASHSSRVPVLCVVIALLSLRRVSFVVRSVLDTTVPFGSREAGLATGYRPGELQVWRDSDGFADHGRGECSQRATPRRSHAEGEEGLKTRDEAVSCEP